MRLLMQKGSKEGTVFPIEKFPAVFGRGEDCTCQLSETGISRRHFVIERNAGTFTIRDLDSKNGTYLNGELVVGKTPIKNGDAIMIANEVILLVFLPEEQIPRQVYPKKQEEDSRIHSRGSPVADSGSFVSRRIEISETSILGPTQEKLYHSYRALKTIYEIVEKCNSEPNPERLFDCLLHSLFKAIRADRGAVVLKRAEEKYHGKAFMEQGETTEEFAISQTILKDVIENGLSVISFNPEEDDRYRFSESLRLQRVASFICAPLISCKNVFGAVYLDRGPFQMKSFSEEELELLAAIGIQMGTALEKSLLLQELKVSLEEKEQLVQALTESEERYALAASGANDGLWDWNLKTGNIYFSPRWKAMVGYEEGEIGNLPEEWFHLMHPSDLDQVKLEIEAHLKGLTHHFENEYRILHKDGSYRWMLTRGLAVRSVEGKAIRMAGSQTDITERKSAEEQLLHDAFHDALTCLPNRALFMDRLYHALLRSQRVRDYFFGVLLAGIDRFRVVNESLGPQAGDQLLSSIAQRFERCLRPGDTVARFAGDEFTILLDDIKDIREITRVAERIQQELASPFKINNQEVIVTASMGIVLGNLGYERAEDIVRNAVSAMYCAKEFGRGRYEVYDKMKHARAVALLQMEMDLRRALEREELEIYYQPIVHLKTGRIASFEALVRWVHPERGIIAPMEFIPLAEETDLIMPLGKWVLERACRQIREWQKKFPMNPPLSVSVNLSPRQMIAEGLVGQIRDALQKSDLEPQSLKLEITETALMEGSDSVLNVLIRLKEMRVQLLMDDFGTGYSSLSYLHRFPFNTLKIDRSFIRDMGQDKESEIVRTILALGRNLNMTVIAEGIETEESLTRLKSLDCEYGQGYFFSRPLNTEAAANLISEGRRWI